MVAVMFHSHPPRTLTLMLSAIVLSAHCASIVNVDGIKLVGQDIPSFKQDFFGGIPFAKPPIGALRFRPPQPIDTLQEYAGRDRTLNAQHFGLACLQFNKDPTTTTEDCLTINVLRPKGIQTHAALPVMTWIYGGSFQTGSASAFNGSALVAQSVSRGTPVIYVNFNYRLGPFGFPQGREAQNSGSLNLGLKDQLAALKWIQKYIHYFGGDRNKVTLFGESAGAMSIGYLFLNSGLQTLVRAAIFESGSSTSVPAFPSDRAFGQANWNNFVAAVPSCASKAGTQEAIPCLQKEANTSALVNAMNIATGAAGEAHGLPWAPNIDGAGGVIPTSPSVLLKQGHFSRVPFIAGTNLDEGTDFTALNLSYTPDLIEQLVVMFFSASPQDDASIENAAETLLRLYPDIPALGSPFNTGNETFGQSPGYKRIAAMNGDLLFQAPRREWSHISSQAGVKNFGYLFIEPQHSGAVGVYHSSELNYVYGNFSALSTTPGRNLSSIMMDYWISFATSLNPNDGKGHPRPIWAQYTPNRQVLMQLNGTNTTLIPDDFRKEQMGFIISDDVVLHRRSDSHLHL